MKCIKCGGMTKPKKVEHTELGVILGTFPAYVCIKCGEVYYDEDTAEKIQKISREKGLFGLARRVKVAEIGNSIAIRVPKELGEFLNLKKGKEVLLYPETRNELRIEV